MNKFWLFQGIFTIVVAIYALVILISLNFYNILGVNQSLLLTQLIAMTCILISQGLLLFNQWQKRQVEKSNS
jgi:hypothetical protein